MKAEQVRLEWTDGNDIRLLQNGTDFFPALCQAIDAAARARDPRVAQVSVALSGSWSVVEIVRADGFVATAIDASAQLGSIADVSASLPSIASALTPAAIDLGAVGGLGANVGAVTGGLGFDPWLVVGVTGAVTGVLVIAGVIASAIHADLNANPDINLPGFDATGTDIAAAFELVGEGGADRLNVREAARRAGVPVQRWAAEGGEDYELLVTLPETFTEAERSDFERATSLALTRIGTVRAGRGVAATLANVPVRLTGFDHFAHP